MGRGKTTRSPGVPHRSGARAGAGTPVSVGADAAAQEMVRAVLAATRAQTKVMVHDALDLFDRGEPAPQFEGAHSRAGGPSADELLRAALCAGWIGDGARAAGFLHEARIALGVQVEALSGADSGAAGLWSLTDSADAVLVRVQWMIGEVSRFAADIPAFIAHAQAAPIPERFGERERAVASVSSALTGAAREDRRADTLALAIQAARLAGDDALADAIAGFGPQRTEALMRVLAALSYDAGVVRYKARDAEGDPALRAMRDIAGDGIAWRVARLEAFSGRRAEVEAMRVLDYVPPRPINDGTGLPPIGQRHTARYQLVVAGYRLRLRAEAQRPMRERLTVSARDMRELIEQLSERPGRVRVRAVRDGPWSRGRDRRLAVMATYEGIARETGEPLRISAVMPVAQSRQTNDAAQRKRIAEKIPDWCPPVEDGYWEISEGGALTPLIAGPPDPGPYPVASLDEHLGAPHRCSHANVTWRERGLFATAVCEDCADELVRRPMLRLGSPTRALESFTRALGSADAGLARLQALACLVGERPPASVQELLDAPRLGDWRTEVRAERASSVGRRRPMTIADAMRRR